MVPRFLERPRIGRETFELGTSVAHATAQAVKEEVLSYADVCAKYSFPMFDPTGNASAIQSLVAVGCSDLHDLHIPIPRRPALVTKAEIWAGQALRKLEEWTAHTFFHPVQDRMKEVCAGHSSNFSQGLTSPYFGPVTKAGRRGLGTGRSRNFEVPPGEEIVDGGMQEIARHVVREHRGCQIRVHFHWTVQHR
jgi:hypothetical protein